MIRIATITLAAATFFVVSHHHALAVPPNTLALGETQTINVLSQNRFSKYSGE